MGIIIPQRYLKALSWWQGDIIHIDPQDDKLIIRNLTQKQLQPMHTIMHYGDAVSRKT